MDDDEFKVIKPKFLKKSKRDRLAKEKKSNLEEENKLKKQQFEKNLLKKKAKRIQTLQEERPKKEISVTPNKTKNNKKKFVFEWNNTEDTSKDYVPLVYVETSKEQLTSYKHWSEKSLEEMTSRDWRIFKEDYEINNKGTVSENPLRSWQESQIPKPILNVVESLGFEEPTPIQRAAIPVALAKKDVLGIAKTGSGKTLSFVIPILAYISKLQKIKINDGPYALILAPTRELAQQIQTEVSKLAKPLKFNSVAIYGGHQLETNVFELAKGAEILIATPGRLLDCLDRKVLVLNQCFYLVMDEADRMIDMGFEEQVKKILLSLPKASINDPIAKELNVKKNITMMYTATMPPEIENLTGQYLNNPRTIIIGNPDKAADTVEQKVEFVNDDSIKQKKLLSLLNSKHYKPPIIIFVNFKKTVDMLYELILTNTKLKPVVIHGSKSQDQREYAIKSLRSGKFDVLVATDVAGRGIDIPNVSLVINYQMSKQIEDYVHRIGRTGRAGSAGTSITYLNPEDDSGVMYDLKTMIMKSEISKCPDELKRHPAALARPNQFAALRN